MTQTVEKRALPYMRGQGVVLSLYGEVVAGRITSVKRDSDAPNELSGVFYTVAVGDKRVYGRGHAWFQTPDEQDAFSRFREKAVQTQQGHDAFTRFMDSAMHGRFVDHYTPRL